MSIFGRLFKVGQANANKAIDKLEKPEVMLDQAIRDQEKAIAEAKKSVQGVIATERQVKGLLDQELNNQKLNLRNPQPFMRFWKKVHRD